MTRQIGTLQCGRARVEVPRKQGMVITALMRMVMGTASLRTCCVGHILKEYWVVRTSSSALMPVSPLVHEPLESSFVYGRWGWGAGHVQGLQWKAQCGTFRVLCIA